MASERPHLVATVRKEGYAELANRVSMASERPHLVATVALVSYGPARTWKAVLPTPPPFSASSGNHDSNDSSIVSRPTPCGGRTWEFAYTPPGFTCTKGE